MSVSWSAGGLLRIINQSKSIQKAKLQIKPIERMKIFKGRVAPPIWGCVFMGLPHLIFFLKIFFLIFFILSVLGIFSKKKFFF